VSTRGSTFRKGFASTFVLDVVGRGLSAITTVLLIRSLSVGSFAFIVLLLNISQFGSSGVAGGTRTRYVRVEAERVSRGIAEPTSFTSALGATLLLIGAGAVACMAVAAVAGAEGPAGEQTGFIALAALLTSGYAGVELAMFHHQAHLAFHKAGLLGVLRSAVMLGVAVATAAGVISRSGNATALYLTVSVLALAVILCCPLAWKSRGSRHGLEGRFGLGGESIWLTLYYLVRSAVVYMTIPMCALLLNDNAVASYGASLRYLSVAMGPVPALLAVLRVRTSQHDVVDSSRLQADLLMTWLRRITGPVLVVLSVAAAAAPILIPLVDQGRYPDSVWLFQLGLFSVFVTYATMPGVNLLQAQRRYRLLALVSAAVLTVKTVLGVAAALVWGLFGLGLVSTLSAATEDGVMALLALKLPEDAGRDNSGLGDRQPAQPVGAAGPAAAGESSPPD
jgi:O-antigen/teichoic acid export membrane protein